jgi:prepilin peptidase CpaA
LNLSFHWSYLILVVLLGIAVYTDVTKHKIYNWLTFPTLIIGLIISFFNGVGILSSLTGFGLSFFICLFLYITKMFKGGDVKLISAVGAWIGQAMILQTMLYIFISGGVLSIIYTLRDGTFFSTLAKVGRFFRATIVPGMSAQAEVQETINKPAAYGIAIAIGTIISLFFPFSFTK